MFRRFTIKCSLVFTLITSHMLALTFIVTNYKTENTILSHSKYDLPIVNKDMLSREKKQSAAYKQSIENNTKPLLVHVDKNSDTPQDARAIHDENVRNQAAAEIYKGPGANGEGVKIKLDSLSAREKDSYDAGWQAHAYNRYVSDLISVHRSLPDVRDPECKDRKLRQQLPNASVVICFHNEAW